MGEPVEQGRGHFGVAEHLTPFREAEIGGDGDAGPLIKFAQEVEQQGAARGAERQVAKLIEDDEIKAHQTLGDLAGFAVSLFLFERINELDGGVKADLLAVMLDSLNAKGCRDVRLARARSADQHDVLSAVQELSPVMLANQGLVDIARREVEPGQVLVDGEAGRLDLIGDRSHFPFRSFRFEKL